MAPSEKRLLRGYGPLACLLAAFVLMAVLVPTVAPDQVTVRVAGAANGTAGNGPGTGGSGPSGATAGPATSGPGQAAPGSNAPGAVQGPTSGPSATAAGTGACADRKEQVPGDPYSPRCIAFSGDNGGATSKGVTKDTITVAFRQTGDPGFQQTLAQLGGAQFSDTPADVRRTILGLADYFNKKFQFYGRKIKIVFYDGQGSQTTELLGGGQQEASADALKVGQQIKAFADLSATTEPYGDALARQKVIGFGVPYLSSQWMTKRRPYAWSLATDCTLVSEASAEAGVKQIAGKPAVYADGNLKNKPRKITILAPDNPWYQECVQSAKDIFKKNGFPPPDSIAYQLNLSTLSNQAASIVAKLKASGTTTVVCGCDPVFPVYLTSKAREQNYFPEWNVIGVALTDQDIVGQLFDQSEWQNAFGISYLGEQVPERASLGYQAYKQVRTDTPANAIQIIYGQMYMLALGLQLAGPDLTPQNFEKGMFSYQGGQGQYGLWGFGPGHYTPTKDGHEIYWDPTATSKVNGKKGAYLVGSPRYQLGQIPKISGQPKAYQP